MKFYQGNKTLVIMLVATVAFALFGFFVLWNRTSTPAPIVTPDNSANQQSSNQQPNPTDQPTPAPVDIQIPGWQTYSNTKYSYELQYPPNLKAGSISSNSVLGDYTHQIRGFHVGPLVFVSLSGSLRKAGADYFNGSYNLALHPPADSPDGPSVSCVINKIVNPYTAVKSVSCTGEGGPAQYALILGKNYDVLVDGYSRGFDNTDFGSFKNATDYSQILSTFKFTGDNAIALTTPPASTPTPPDTTVLQPPVLTFSVTTDDNSASVARVVASPKAIVEITFIVSSLNVGSGGLAFKSGVINTGTILPGQAKTISFTAEKSFSFTPYSPDTGTSRNYTIGVVVQ